MDIQSRWGQKGSEEDFQRRNPRVKPWGPQEPAQVQSRDERKEGQDTGAMKEEAVALKESQFVVSGVVVEGETVRQGEARGQCCMLSGGELSPAPARRTRQN